MTTWRERIAEAEARGSFTEDDSDAIADHRRCMVAEAATLLGRPYWVLAADPVIRPNELAALKHIRVRNKEAEDIAAAARALDAIEDRALALKREAGSVHAPASLERSEDAP